MKKIFMFGLTGIICCIMLANLCVSAARDTAFSWYCVRNKDHKQPIADANMRFIEQYNGYYIDHKHHDQSDEKVVYLTFDAGYENGNIEKILDILKQEQVTGAFFILGNLIERNPDLVKRMGTEGHIVANHTNHHKDMTTLDQPEAFQKELDSLNDLYRNVIGQDLAKYYRPPEGKFDERSMVYANQLGYKTIFWSLAYADWDNANQPSPESAKKKILDNIHNGAIILLHPTSSTNVCILSEVIQTLKHDGYRFGTLDELTDNRT